MAADNLPPLAEWGIGAQMLAMNFQTYDLPMQLNRALFQLDGGGGYVLKPPAILGGGVNELDRNSVGDPQMTLRRTSVQVLTLRLHLGYTCSGARPSRCLHLGYT